jgi:hypothetical protein
VRAAPDGYLVRNADQLEVLTPLAPCCGDFSLNIANPLSAAWFLDHWKLQRLTASYDLDLKQMLAQVRGCPVVVADAGSLPEVADPTDLVDPDDVAGWAAAMHDVLRLTDAERQARADRGRALAAGFTPVRTARAQLAAYRQARG